MKKSIETTGQSIQSAEPLPVKLNRTAVQDDGPPSSDNISLPGKFYQAPSQAIDEVPAHLTMAEEIVYHHMVRLSYGRGRTSCRVGYDYFLKKSSIKGRATVIHAIKGLIKKGLLIPSQDVNQRGTCYTVCVPEGGENITNISMPDFNILKINMPDVPSQNPAAINRGDRLNSGTPTTRPNKRKFFKPTPTHISDTADQQATTFYSSIGQTKISHKESVRAREVYNSLKREGFTDEDISFAIDWTLHNLKEVRSFAIIEHTIGQALAEREKLLEQQARKEHTQEEEQTGHQKHYREKGGNAKDM